MRLQSSHRVLVFAAAFLPGLISCTRAEMASNATSELARPKVVMAADPQPPFTYWAPENSTIRNHPRQPGIWIAESENGARKYYFGDRCHASEFQSYVGRRLDSLPSKPAEALWRLTCSTCATLSDLGWARMNVSYDQSTKTIEEISCG